MEDFWKNIRVVTIDGDEMRRIIFDMELEERKSVDSYKLYFAAEQMKEQGNEEFKKSWYTQAIKYYIIGEEICEALNFNPEKSGVADLRIHQEVCNNAALTFFKMGKYKHAIKHAKLGVKVPVTNPLKGKSHYLWAKALFELGKFDECFDNLEKAQQLRDDIDPCFIDQVKGKVEAAKKTGKVSEDGATEGEGGKVGTTGSNA